MKVLHVPFGYHPDPVGGTEVYVGALARALRELGVSSVIAAPTASQSRRVYDHDGLRVHRFPAASASFDLRTIYGAGDPGAVAPFADILREEIPDVVHLHALTAGASLLLVREARRAGIPVVFTYHTPTVSCIRGSMRRPDGSACDGRLDVRRCAACAAHGRGAGALLSGAIARVPVSLGARVASLPWSGSVATALRQTELISLRHDTIRAFLAEVDAIVAVCDWVREVLLVVGAAPEKIVLSRQGADAEPVRRTDGSARLDGTLRAVMLGRADPTKGFEVVLDAIASDPRAPWQLDVYAISSEGERGGTMARLRQAAARDPRVRILPPIAPSEVVSTLSAYDVVLVPSLWLETGPLVVLEAFAAGVPVVASQLGGMAELVRHDVDGLLVPPASPAAWAAALRQLQSDPSVLSRLRAGVRVPRSMRDAAADMRAVYDRVRRARRRSETSSSWQTAAGAPR